MDGPATAPRPPALDADCALFLDVDGTLVAFAPTPERAFVPASLRDRLRRLGAALDGALALVSGRSLDALDALFDPLRLPAAGLHGHEVRTHAGVRLRAAPSTRLPAIALEAAALCRLHPGAVVEDKGASLALHWRNAAAAEHVLRRFADAALRRLPGYRLQEGQRVIELLPAGRDKGDAIAMLLEDPPFRGRRPVFVGDDLTDEPGFRAVNARCGISVLVGTRAGSAARHVLPDTASVLDWLDDFTQGDAT